MRMGTVGLVAVAMVAFAGNSLLARGALAEGGIDAVSFTAIRIVSGAVALGGVLVAQGRGGERPGNWGSGVALLAYALGFSLAYLRLGAATGALILFASVQGTMIAWGVMRREWPTGVELVGLGIAFAGFVYLLLPGLRAPDPVGSVLMMGAGAAWGVYTLRGRGRGRPLEETAGNFVRAGVMCLPALAMPWLGGRVSGEGVGLAVVSGVVTSGLGYAIWYRALPGLSTTQAATVQLTVPMIAAFGALVMLGEVLTLRLVGTSVCILGGVAVAILVRRRG